METHAVNPSVLPLLQPRTGNSSLYRPKGTLRVTLGDNEYEITGGPYRGKPHDALGIKLAAEISAPCTINLPIADFSVPTQHAMESAVLQAVTLLLQYGDDHEVYAGCMGGIGRTGLFFSCLAKVEHAIQKPFWKFWIPSRDPVRHVRDTYCGHAVETKEQQEFVADFDAKALARFLKRYLTN